MLFRSIAAAIDDHSAHPLAKAVVAYAKERSIPFTRAESYQNRSGRGAEGMVEGHPHFVGNHRFAHELGVCNEAIERRVENRISTARRFAVIF